MSTIRQELRRVAGLLTAGRYTKEKVCKDMRIKWDDHFGILMEELPAKGKKRLRVLSFGIMPYLSQADGLFNIPNVIQAMKLSKSQTYNAAKKGIEAFSKERFKEVEKKTGKDVSRGINMSENTVHYLQVEPVGMKKLSIKAKDFDVAVEWTSFRAYSPDSNFQSHDPSYTLYESKSVAAGRKMYKVLSANNDALKSVAWDNFGRWLDAQGIKYDIQFSSWR